MATFGSKIWTPGDGLELNPSTAEIQASAASFVYACLKNGFTDEAQEFTEWFLETFDIDLED